MADSDDNPVFKITIQRESSASGGEPKFTLVPENFSLTSQSAPVTPVAVASESSVRSPAFTPVFSSRTYTKCAVPNCNNYFDGQRSEFMGISYFPFPQDPELRQEWITAIELPPDKDPDQLKVCSDHFMNKDFVSCYIAVEDGSGLVEHANQSRVQDIELKPGVKPSVKLGANAKDPNVRSVSAKGKKGGGKTEKFEGLESRLMDTANELRSSSNSSATEMVSESSLGLKESNPPDFPVITSVGMIYPINLNNTSNSEVSVGAISRKDLDRERANTLGKLVDVVEVEDDEDDMIEEMMAQSSARNPRNTKANPDNVLEKKGEDDADRGLINVPALVKLPPRKTITGDSSTGALSTAPAPVTTLSKADAALPSTSDSMMSGTSRCPPDRPLRRRRGRPTKEEVLRRQEEEEWEPTFWSKKTLAKQGYAFQRKYRGPKKKAPAIPPKPAVTSEDDFLDFDEGFRIDDPITTRSQGGSPEKRRRPGPASRTSRPQYVPPACNESGGDPEHPANESPPENGASEKDLEEVLADKSLLVDWAFFKSLLPDLRRMSRDKRDELKTFMLDTLNSRIYEGKPITLDCRDHVKT